MEMSLTSKLFLACSITASMGTIMYVHYKQEYDHQQLQAGVMKDLDRQRRRKIENIYLLQQQSEVTKELQKDFTNKTTDSNAMPS